MLLTVEQIMGIFPLNQGKLRAGGSGTKRVVRSVNVMDAPDICSWLKRGEMLLTSAFVFKGYPEAERHLIRRLHDAGCSALGIKAGRYWEDIPGHLLEEADELGFPLIELPYEYTFSDMMRGIYTEALGGQVKELSAVLNKQKQLMKLALSRSSERAVYRALADILGHRIAVISRGGHLLFNSSGRDESFWRPRLEFHAEARWCGFQETRYFQVPLRYGDAFYGFLMVVPDGGASVRDEDALFVQAGEVLAHYMSRTKMQMGEGQEWLNDLMRYLQNRAPLAVLLSSLDQSGIVLPFDGYVCCLTVVPEEGMEELWELRETLEYDPDIRRFNGFHVPMGHGCFSIFPVGATAAGDGAKAAAGTASAREYRELGESLRCRLSSSGARLYFSRVKDRAADLKEAFDECSDAQHTVERFGLAGDLFYCDELDVYRLLKFIPDELLADFSQKILGPLRQSEEMLETLEVFLELDGQINEVARKLYVHRNTVAYRMEKIHALLHVDTRKYDDIFKLKLAFWSAKARKEHADGKR